MGVEFPWFSIMREPLPQETMPIRRRRDGRGVAAIRPVLDAPAIPFREPSVRSLRVFAVSSSCLSSLQMEDSASGEGSLELASAIGEVTRVFGMNPQRSSRWRSRRLKGGKTQCKTQGPATSQLQHRHGPMVRPFGGRFTAGNRGHSPLPVLGSGWVLCPAMSARAQHVNVGSEPPT